MDSAEKGTLVSLHVSYMLVLSTLETQGASTQIDAGLLSSHLSPSQRGRRQLPNQKLASMFASTMPKGMSLGEVQSQS